MKKHFKCILSTVLIFSALTTFAQSIRVSVEPVTAKLSVNCNSSSSPVKVRGNQTGTAVLAFTEGYSTQGLLATELGAKGVSEYTIKLPKVVKPAKDFNSRKIEFTKLAARDGSDAYPQLATTIKSTMTAAGYKLVGTNNMFSSKSDVPDLAVGGEITWLANETAGPGFQAAVLIHWSVFSVSKENVVYESTTGGYSDSRRRGPWIDELTLAVKDALNGLIYDPKFQDLAIKKSETVAASPKEAVVLTKPTLKKFANYSAVVKESVGSVVTIKTNFGIGSGFTISDNGYILTNHHVVNSAEKIEVVFDNGFSFEAKLIRSDEDRDVALIKMSGSGFKPLPLNAADDLASTGTEVIAIGTPENIKLGQTVTKGIISGKRELDEKVFLQTDVAINSGNSGGPLINTTTGEVIGIVAAKIKAKGVEGLGFAIPISEAISALNLKFE